MVNSKLYSLLKKIYISVIRWLLQRIYSFKLMKLKLISRVKRVNINISSSVRINQSTRIDGKGCLLIGSNVMLGYKLGGRFRGGQIEIQPRLKQSSIEIQEGVAINNSFYIVSANSIVIEKNTRIGSNVTIFDFEAHGTSPERRHELGRIGQVHIGENVWIGSNVIILKDVWVGKNSIISAGSVVYKGVYPENSIIGGNPAKTICGIKC